MQSVHFDENSGCCRAHSAAWIRVAALKIKEEPRKNVPSSPVSHPLLAMPRLGHPPLQGRAAGAAALQGSSEECRGSGTVPVTLTWCHPVQAHSHLVNEASVVCRRGRKMLGIFKRCFPMQFGLIAPRYQRSALVPRLGPRTLLFIPCTSVSLPFFFFLEQGDRPTDPSHALRS